MKTVSVSVLLPFCNPGSYFREAVESILNQDFANFELVLINNNSDRDSVAFAQNLSSHNSRVRVFEVNDEGITHALNAGLDQCRGKFIARMDADDVCLPGRLKLQHDFLIHNEETGMVGGLAQPITMGNQSEGMLNFIYQSNNWISDAAIYQYRFIESPFIHPTVMFRKELIEKFGKYAEGNLPEDYELWLRWFSKGVKMSKVPVSVLAWRDHPSRLTRMHQNYNREAFRWVRQYYLLQWLKNHGPLLPPVWIWGGGKYSRRNAAFLEANGITINGFIDIFPQRIVNGYRVMHYSDIPPKGNIFIISMISNRGKYQEVEAYLHQKGYEFEKDFILSA